MTAPTYDTLTSDDTGADKILTTGTVVALDQNPVSIAQRGTSAPRVQVPVREYKTSGTGATWTIPDGVTAFTLIGVGAGGGGAGGGGGGNGSSTTATYNGVTYTANGGTGQPGASNNVTGGTASNGDENMTGQSGCGSVPGVGGLAAVGGSSYGAGGDGAQGGGSGGGTFRVRVAVVSGQTTVTYTVPSSGGTAGTAGGVAGKPGLLIIEY